MPQKDKLILLQRYWGHSSFRPLQAEIIDSVLQGNDTLALLPTGGGKSICYQIPALMLEGVCLVVSPLIALMKDQVQHLREKGIKATCLTSGLNSYEQEIVLNNCMYGKTKLLYVSPERLKQRSFIEHFRRMNIAMIAVDEAHCISQWGYDFRPPYLEISKIRQYHPQAPVLALTATATPQVVADIQEQLLFRQGRRVFKASFFRENLAYMVFREEDKRNRLLRVVRNVNGCGIVYVRNRRRTREVADFLSFNGISATYYHAGLNQKERDLRQSLWMDGKVQIIVATNAFGMGIDKPNVRVVVHLDIPSSPEAYFQEAGRAGRDGLKAFAVLLYSENDLELMEKHFEESFPDIEQIRTVYRGLCNYFQIPIGAGGDSQYDFDIESFCSTYRIGVSEFYHAAHFLDREGLISIPDREETESQIYVPISREDLYKFQVEQRRYGDLMTLILRMYGGMFTEFVAISEREIARKCYSDEKTITNMLSHLDALKVIVYKKKSSKPQLYFTCPRVDERDIYISDQYYKDLKQNVHQRMQAMKDYIGQAIHCRSEFLLAYFGEQQAGPCQKCDLCILNKKKDGNDNASFSQAPKREQTIEEQIIQMVKGHPLRSQEIYERLGLIDEESLRRVLEKMVHNNQLSINQAFQFFV